MFLINDPDDDLIKGIRSLNEKDKRTAENTLFKKYFFWIKSATFNHRISEDDAFTAYSKACHSVIEAIEKERFKGESVLKTYFKIIFDRRVLDFLRHPTTKFKTYDIDEVFVEAETKRIVVDINETIDNDSLKQCLKNLEEPCYSVLTMWSEGYSHAEIHEFVLKLFDFNGRIDDKIKSCLEVVRKKIKWKI